MTCKRCGKTPYAGFRRLARVCRVCEAEAAQARRGPRQRFSKDEARDIERRLRLILAPEYANGDCKCGECDALRAQKQADAILKVMRR